MKKYLILILFSVLSCRSAVVRVMPGENGINKAISKDRTKEGAETAAVDDAKEYCEKKDKEAVFIKDESKYKGDMDESTRKTIDQASTAAIILGGVGSVPGSTRTAGTVLGGAGTVGKVMTSGKDYEAEVQFKCQ